ncbi:hypothetical protein DC498_24090 [Terrimonas sp.]|nr:hypothetical protein DC498_24090 [Terrimonas sp.]
MVKELNPEMILLLGASVNRRRTESIFQQESPTAQYISGCFLLMLIADADGKPLYEWQDRVETICKNVLPVTAIVLPTTTLNQWSEQGHLFSRHVQVSALVIYDAGRFSMPKNITPVSEEVIKQLHKDHQEGITRAWVFLTGAEFFSRQNQNAMAAFMLHQSAEQALHTLISVATGYKTTTHNIDRLLRYGALVSYQLPDIFPRNTDKEKQLFQVLQEAYLASRYKDSYSVTSEDVYTLITRIKTVIAIAELSGKQAITKHLRSLSQ